MPDFSFAARCAGLAVCLLVAGCYTIDQKYGASVGNMYPDQITIAEILPANAPSINQHYRRLPGGGGQERDEHLGIDITAAKGTPVLAAAAGRVVLSLREPMYGNTVIIDHPPGADGTVMRTLYKHLNSRSVRAGDTVARGQPIGGLGRSGLLASGILHLHFELRKRNARGRYDAVDPGGWWTGGRGRVTCFDATLDWPDSPFRITYPVACR